MDSNCLKMNNSKTEFILLGHPKQLKKLFGNSLEVNGEVVNSSINIKYLGVYLDNELNIKQHITYKCKFAMPNIHQIRNIISTLTTEATHTLILSSVMPHLNFCNNVLFGLQQKSIKTLLLMQNIAVKLIAFETEL